MTTPITVERTEISSPPRQLDLPTVNVSNFTSAMPGRICIARTMPRGMDIPHLTILAPSRELLSWWRRSGKTEADWHVYTTRFWREVADRCKGSERVWTGAKSLLSDRLTTDMRGACLAFILKSAAAKLRIETLTLCCYEKPEDEHCHRKLIYDALPDLMKGIRG